MKLYVFSKKIYIKTISFNYFGLTSKSLMFTFIKVLLLTKMRLYLQLTMSDTV